MSLSAAILAGGRAARFGSPKGLALFGDVAVIERQLAALTLRADRIALVGNELRAFEGYGGDRLERIADVAMNKGPMAGLAAALEWSPTDWVLVLASDMPLLSAAAIDRLTSARDEVLDERPDLAAIAPVVDGRVQPLAALYNKVATRVVTTCVSEERLSPRRLFDDAGEPPSITVRFAGDDALAITGFNSQDELDDLRQYCNFPADG